MSPSFKLTTALILQKKILSIPDLVYILFFPHCTCWLNEGKFKFNPEIEAPSTLSTPEKWTTFSLWKRINCFPFTLRRRNIKNETINGPDCVCRGLGQGNHLIITSSSIFGMLRFQKVFRSHYNADSGCFQIPPVLKSIFEKLHFLDRLVWKWAAFSNITEAVWTRP